MGRASGLVLGLDSPGQLQSRWVAACSSEWSAKAGPPWGLEGGEEGLSPFVSRAVEGTLANRLASGTVLCQQSRSWRPGGTSHLQKEPTCCVRPGTARLSSGLALGACVWGLKMDSGCSPHPSLPIRSHPDSLGGRGWFTGEMQMARGGPPPPPPQLQAPRGLARGHDIADDSNSGRKLNSAPKRKQRKPLQKCGEGAGGCQERSNPRGPGHHPGDGAVATPQSPSLPETPTPGGPALSCSTWPVRGTRRLEQETPGAQLDPQTCQHLSPRGQTGTWAGPRTARLPPARGQDAWPLAAVAVPRRLRGQQQGSRSYALASVGSSAFSEGPRAHWGWGWGGGSALGRTQPVSAGKLDHRGEGQNLYCDDGRSRHILCLLVSELNLEQLCHLAQVL